jgi:hypothetical protein
VEISEKILGVLGGKMTSGVKLVNFVYIKIYWSFVKLPEPVGENYVIGFYL